MIIIEIVLCFGLLVFQLLLGILFLPSQVLMLSDGQGNFAWVGLTIGGIIGLVGMVKCVKNLFRDCGPLGRPLLVIAMIATGIVTIIIQLFGAVSGGLTLIEAVVYIAPLLCTAHVLYISRAAFRRASDS